MSGFSLHPNESAGLLETRVGDPATRDEAPPPGFFAGLGTATGHGLLAAGASTRATIDTLTDSLPDAFFEDDDGLPKTQDERTYGSIRASNRPNPAAMGAMLQDLRPDPQTTGILGQVTYGLGVVLPPAIAGGAVGGPAGAAGAVGLVTGVGDYQSNLADGLDKDTAASKAILTGGTNALGAVMPASLGGTILSRIGSGVALNVPLGVAQRGATAALLRANGYDEMADQYRAFDGTEVLIDAVAGAAFGALPGHAETPRAEVPTGQASLSSEAPPAAVPPAVDDTSVVNSAAPSQPIPVAATPAERVLPSDVDLALTANGMNQFELDAAPGIPTTPTDRNTHVKAMDTAYGQLMRDEPVDVSHLNHGEMLPKPENNPLNEALTQALDEGGYNDLLRDADTLREEAKVRDVPLGEDLTLPPLELDTRKLYERAVDLHSMSPDSHPFYDQAAAIRQLVSEGKQMRTNFQLFNRNSPNEVQRLTNWPARPLPLLDFIKEAGGIMSGVSKDEAADMRARGVKLTPYYTSDVKALFEGRQKIMNSYVRHDGLSLEDELPNLAAEQGYLGEALMSDEYRAAHPEEAQQKLYAALKKGLSGKPTYDYRVEDALGKALAENEATQGLDKADAATSWLDELNRHGLTSSEPTVPQIAEALAKRQKTLDAEDAAARQPSPRPFEGYEDIPFMRAPAVIEAFPRPVDEQDVNPLGFYSQLSRVAHMKLPGRGEGKDFAKALDAYAKNGDFKPEELAYSGVKEWLSTKEKVSKGEVLDFLKNGGVKLDEVTLGYGSNQPTTVERANYDERIRAAGAALEAQGYTYQPEPYGMPGEFLLYKDGVEILPEETPEELMPFATELEQALAQQDLDANRVHRPPSETKYSRYALAGGENYREVLLTLPERKGLVYTKDNVMPLRVGDDPAVSDPERFWYFKTPDNVFQILKRTVESEAAAKDYVIRMKQPESPVAKNFRTGHWDQPNVLAHFRLADHTDAEGNKVLLIEEIQSDWHQAGRKYGYKDSNLEAKKIEEREASRKAYNELISQMQIEFGNRMEQALGSKEEGLRMVAQTPVNTMARIIGRGEDWQRAVDRMGNANDYMDKAVPDAPFKKTWAELSVKRILRMAAERGYQKVAWTTGEMQADRFSLHREISDITYDPRDNTLVAHDKAKRPVINQKVAPEKLEDYIGKEAAQKLLATSFDAANPYSFHTLIGEDLKVGGEGMKGFYDDILPKTVGKVIGKLDKAAKVDEVKLGRAASERDDYGIEELDNGQQFAHVGKNTAQFATWSEANKWLKATLEPKVHGFDVTEELRDRVMMGLPQFFRASGGKLPENLEQLAPGLAAKAPEGMSADDYMVAQQVNTTVARMLPGAQVRMAGKLFSTGEVGAAGEVFGAFRPLNVRESRGVVDWSLAAPDAEGVARHEVLHGLKQTGLFKPEEWQALELAAREEDWAGQAKLPEGYKPEQLLEEGIAERFRTWRRETPEKQVSGVSGIVYKAFARLERLLSRVGEIARHYMGMKPTADDVFSRIERGEVGKREPATPGAEEQPHHAVTQAEQILAEKPETRIPDEDGGMIDGKLAMIEASADAIRAEQHGPLYEVAVNCFMRG